jgi:hypothetical protein
MSRSELFSAFWHGSPLSAVHWACLASFIEMGHRVDLYAYHPVEVPPGISVVDASEVLPPAAIFCFKDASGGVPDIGPFSDVFRFKLLLEKGGWWVDTDVLCASTQFPECRYAWANEFQQNIAPSIGTSQIKFPKGDPIIRQLYDECSRLAPVMRRREEIGPEVISRVVEQYGTPEGHFGSTEQFYPLEWIEAFKLWLPECRDEVIAKTKRAYFVACWASLAGDMGIDLNRMPPRGSYLADLLGRLAPSRDRSEMAISSAELTALVRNWFRDRDWAVRELQGVTSSSVLEQLEIGFLHG